MEHSAKMSVDLQKLKENCDFQLWNVLHGTFAEKLVRCPKFTENCDFQRVPCSIRAATLSHEIRADVQKLRKI